MESFASLENSRQDHPRSRQGPDVDLEQCFYLGSGIRTILEYFVGVPVPLKNHYEIKVYTFFSPVTSKSSYWQRQAQRAQELMSWHAHIIGTLRAAGGRGVRGLYFQK